MLFFPFCHSKGASICSSHGVSRRSRGFFVPNFRIIEYLSHGESRRSRIFFVPNLRICELFLHTENRGDHGFFLVTRLVLGPTDQREVIFELSNCFLHTDCRGIIFFITNYQIIEYLSHGMSRSVAVFLSRDLPLDPLTNGGGDCRISLKSHEVSRMVVGLALHVNGGLFVVVYRPIRGVCV